MTHLTIHWFRRDLRLEDNTGFNAALRESQQVIPLFIVDETLLKTQRGGGSVRLSFLADALQSLADRLHQFGSALVIRRGEPLAVLHELIQQTGATRLTYNRDYSPYARQRDPKVADFLRANNLQVDTYQDLVLHEYPEIVTDGGTPFQIYTPYRRRWEALPKPKTQPLILPLPPLPPNLDRGTLPTLAELGGNAVPEPITRASENHAEKHLTDFIAQGLTTYNEGRNLLAENGTSCLSPHLRWGTISIRRCYAAANGDGDGAKTWVSELAWRDFYHMILAYYPRVLTQSYRTDYDRIQWENNPDWFAAWCAGQTGYPIVDAAMRQLLTTGWMHNRARMIVASFLCKDLLIDWRWGEKFFMQHLLDGDTAANNGGWQWSAGTGTDAAPYFRIFNPVSQGEKFDPNGVYVRRWLPELSAVPSKLIHQPWLANLNLAYPPPIVDHAVQRGKALALYGVVKK